MTGLSANDDEIPVYDWRFTRHLDPDRDGWHGVSGGDLPCPIRIRIATLADGRLRCTGLRIDVDDGELTTKMVRSVRLGNVIRSLREALGGMHAPDLQIQHVPGQTLAEWVREGLPRTSVRRGRLGLDPETLRRTAEVYRQVAEEGIPQRLAECARRLGVSQPSTVSRRLQRAWRLYPELRPAEGE